MPLLSESPLLRSAHKPHSSPPRNLGNKSQLRLERYGYDDDALKFSFKTRKFEDFSAGENVTMGRETAPTFFNKYRQAILEPPSRHFAPPDFPLPAQPISQSIGQPTTPNPEDHVTSSTFQQPTTRNLEDYRRSLSFQHPMPQSTSSQMPANSESHAPASNWRHALVSSCAVGVTLVAVATGYACTTVFRGALNVGKFVYSNGNSIHQTCTTYTQAVQSTCSAAKRRMVSIRIPRLPVGMRRYYAPQPTAQNPFRQRRLPQLSRGPAKLPSQSINPVVTRLVPEGIPGVEYSGLSEVGKFPDAQDAADPDAFVLPRTFDALASGAPFMTGGLFHEQTPPSAPVHEEVAFENPSDTLTPEEMELIEQLWISYEESVSGFSEDTEDENRVEGNEANRVATAKLFRDEGHMDVEEDWWFLPGQSEHQSPSKASTSLADPNQAGSTSASPVFETASHVTEAAAPVIEHASTIIIEPGSPVTEPSSPHLSRPDSFPSPPSPAPTPQRPITPSPPARQAGQRRRHKAAPSGKSPRKNSPPKPTRRSNRIAKLEAR